MTWQAQSWLALGAGALSLYGLYFSWRCYQRVRALADTPIAKIRSAHQGYVELRGHAALLEGEPVIAPLSGLACAWYHYRVDEYGEHRRSRSLLDKGVSDALFVLEDETGRCVVDPDEAEFIDVKRRVWYTDRNGMRIFSLAGIGAQYRYIEERIAVGDELHIIGQFKTVGGSSEVPDTRREVADLLEQWKRDPRMIALFDRRKNNRIDPDEWEAARRAAHRQVQRKQLERLTHPEVHTIARPEARDRPYLISTICESRVIHKYQLEGLLALAAALAAGAYLAWLLA